MNVLKFEKLLFGILAFASILVLYKYIIIFTNPDNVKPQKDLYIYLTAAHILRDGNGSELYTLQTQTAYQNKLYGFELALPFRYPPLTALLFLPFASVKPSYAYIIFAILNTVMMFIGIEIVSPKSIKKLHKAIMYMLVFTSLPIVALTHLGQIYGLTFIILVVIYKLLKSNNYYIAGMMAGLLFLKPQMLLVIPFLLIMINSKRHFITGFLITIFFEIAASALISGTNFVTNYIDFVTTTETVQLGSHPETMMNYYNIFIALTKNPALALILNIFCYIIIFGLLLASRNKPLWVVFSCSVLFSVVVSPHNTSIDYLLLGILCLIQLTSVQTTLAKLSNSTVLIILFITPVFTYLQLVDIKLEIILITSAAILKLMEAEIIKLGAYFPRKNAGISYLPSESESPGFH